jgi:hypothetical protein
MTKPTELQRRSGSGPDIAPGTSADNSSPPLHPLRPGDREPTTYFELQRKGLSSDPDSLRGISAEIPPLPPSSPWASDPVPDEPLIDRSDDGDEMGVEIDQLNR